jgi:hypothetical protein
VAGPADLSVGGWSGGQIRRRPRTGSGRHGGGAGPTRHQAPLGRADCASLGSSLHRLSSRLNAKGGSDVVVAILGHKLGLLSGLAYTSYTVVAITTVLFIQP